MSSDRASFNVRAWLSNDQPQQVAIVQPKCVSCWTKESITTGGAYKYGSHAGLSTYRHPQLPASLGAGYPDAYVKKDDGEATPVEVVIRGATHSRFSLKTAHICTFRNNLNKLLLTPVSPKNEWTIDACYHNETLFLDIVKTPQKDFPGADLFTYYGYKFEALCTGDNETVDSTSEFALLLNLRLGSHTILMAAEVDCASTDAAQQAPGSMHVDQFVELKTAMFHPNRLRREESLAQKYPRWWVQSFLAGIPTLVVGGRDDKGMLNEIMELPVHSLPSQAAALGRGFDAWQLLRFADSALSWMLGLGRGRPRQHLRFQYQPSTQSIDFGVVAAGDLPQRLQRELG